MNNHPDYDLDRIGGYLCSSTRVFEGKQCQRI
jgi:hypothetical protein